MKSFTQIRGVSYKKIVSWYWTGDPCLRAVSDEIPQHLITSPEIKFLIARMKKVLKYYNCVGLAAPQIGIPVRLMLLEFNKKHMKCYTDQERKVKEMELLPQTVMINPEMKITDYTKLTFTENCESVKGFHADVPRYRSVELKGNGEQGETVRLEAKGWLARIIQHEMDHLNGKLYTDIMDRKTLTCSCWQTINERSGKVELPYH